MKEVSYEKEMIDKVGDTPKTQELKKNTEEGGNWWAQIHTGRVTVLEESKWENSLLSVSSASIQFDGDDGWTLTLTLAMVRRKINYCGNELCRG